jgi:hypothetical protein
VMLLQLISASIVPSMFFRVAANVSSRNYDIKTKNGVV